MVPIDLVEAIKIARAYAHMDTSRHVLERTMSKLAAADSTRSPSAAARQLVNRAAPKVVHSVGEPEASLSASPTLESGRGGDSDSRLDGLAARAGLSEMEKEAFIRAAKGLMGRLGSRKVLPQAIPQGAARATPRQARNFAPVGSAPARAPVALRKADIATPRQARAFAPVPQAATSVTRRPAPVTRVMSRRPAPVTRVMSRRPAPVTRVMSRRAGGTGGASQTSGRQLVPAQAPAALPAAQPAGAGVTNAGAYRTSGRKLTAAEEAQLFSKPMTQSTKQVKEMGRKQKTPGLFRTMAGPLVLPALTVGGLYAGKKFVDAASRASNRPAPYSFGRDQFAWGYGPQGQAPF